MKVSLFGLFALAGLLAVAPRATAQSINIDIDNLYGTPSNALAGAGHAGTWNFVPVSTSGSSLFDTAGAPTTVMITRTSGQVQSTGYPNIATLGDDRALLDDAQDPGNSSVWTISNLTGGSYTVYTYGWAPDDLTFRTGVSVNGSSITSVGGNFTGSYVAGTTHAVNNVTVPAGGNIVITLTVVSTYATFNGVQIVDNSAPPPPSFTGYCFGDGTGGACPCGNTGSAGNGCASSVTAAGAHLGGSGVPSIANDTLSLNGSGMTNSFALYFQGTTQIASGAGVAFGDGLRCAGGSVIRLGTKMNTGGASTYPSGSTAISIKGADAAGNTRTYQCWYRNAAVFCNPETFNLTNGGQTTWIP